MSQDISQISKLNKGLILRKHLLEINYLIMPISLSKIGFQ